MNQNDRDEQRKQKERKGKQKRKDVRQKNTNKIINNFIKVPKYLARKCYLGTL